MKLYNFVAEEYESVVFVGNAAEIKCLYKALTRREKSGKDWFCRAFTDFPIFNESRLYALEIDESGEFCVLGEGTIARFFYEGWLSLRHDCGDCAPHVKGRVTIDEDEDEDEIDLFPDCEVDLEF